MGVTRNERVCAFIGGRLAALDGAGDLRALFACVERNGRARFSNWNGQTLRYRELCAGARRAAAALSALSPGVVGIHLPNSPAWALAFWGALISGHAPLLLDAAAPLGAHARALKAVEAVAVVSQEEGFAELPVLPARALAAGGPPCTERWENRVLLMTSGTTGHPHMVEFGGAALVAQMRAARDMGEETVDIVYPTAHGAMRQLALLPFHHVFGFAACFLWYSFFGAQFVFPTDRSPEKLLALSRGKRATHVFAVPQFYKRLLAGAEGLARALYGREGDRLVAWLRSGRCRGESERERFDKLCAAIRKRLLGTRVRFMISGGAAPSRAVLGALNRLGYPLCNGYGMTEIGIVAVELSARADRRQLGRVGHPLHGVRFALAGDGELLVDADCAASRALEGGQWRALPRPLPTGDLAERDESGGYRLIGRKRDMLLSDNGENVFPAELEEPLDGAPGVAALCALLSPEGRGLSLAAEMEGGAEASPLMERVAELNARLPLSRRIQAVYLTDAPLRAGAKGDVDRSYVAALLRDRPDRFARWTPAAVEGVDEKLTARVRAIFAASLGRGEGGIGSGDHFLYDLGGDSFLYAGLLNRIEREFGISIPDGERSAYITVREAAQRIEGHGGK